MRHEPSVTRRRADWMLALTLPSVATAVAVVA